MPESHQHGEGEGSTQQLPIMQTSSTTMTRKPSDNNAISSSSAANLLLQHPLHVALAVAVSLLVLMVMLSQNNLALLVVLAVILVLASMGLVCLYCLVIEQQHQQQSQLHDDNDDGVSTIIMDDKNDVSLLELTAPVVQKDQDDAAAFFRDTPNNVRNRVPQYGQHHAPSSSSAVAVAEPKDGVYEIIYTVLLYNKAIRCQGDCMLSFQKAGGGWEITGEQRFRQGTPNTRISDGFVNRAGDCYWVTSSTVGSKQRSQTKCAAVEAERTMNRGHFDFDRQAVLEGEYHSGTHSGRIVRLARTGPLPAEQQQQQPRAPATDNNAPAGASSCSSSSSTRAILKLI